MRPTSHEATRPPNATIKTYTDSAKVISLGFNVKAVDLGKDEPKRSVEKADPELARG